MRGKFRCHGHLFIVENPSTCSGCGDDLGSISNWKQIALDRNEFGRDELGRLQVHYELGSRDARIGDVGLRREHCCWTVVPACWASAALRAAKGKGRSAGPIGPCSEATAGRYAGVGLGRWEGFGPLPNRNWKFLFYFQIF
jgi:hypothetical protein